MKKLILFLLVTAFSMAAHADEAELQVWKSDGQVVSISLDEQPVTTYADGNLVIKTSKTTITYPLEEVKKYTYVIPKKKFPGDADGNGKLETLDVLEIFNKIKGKPSNSFVDYNADVNGDGVVNILDIILIINSMLESQ